MSDNEPGLTPQKPELPEQKQAEFPQNATPLPDRLSRRSFLKGLGAAAGVMLMNKFIPHGVAEAAPIPESQEQEAAGWGDLPLVEGEPTMTGEVVLPETGILRIDQEMNSRPANTRVGSEGVSRAANTYIEVTPGEEDMEDASGEAFRWTGGDLIFDPTKGVVIDATTREHLYVANSIGNTTLITVPADLPPEIQELYRTVGELPEISGTFPAAALTEIFNQFGGGGSEDPLTAAARTWEVDDTAAFTKEITASPLRAWQLSTYMTAVGDGGEDISQEVNICAFTGEKGSCNYYRLKREGNAVDVIGRMSNPDDSQHPDIFVVTRFEDQEGQKKVVGSGFVTPEGLAAAYGAEAPKIASAVTALDGEEAVELARSIAELEQGKVFLAGMGEFVNKIVYSSSLFEEMKVSDEDNPNIHYIRDEKGDYHARLITSDREEPLAEWRYRKKYNKGEWALSRTSEKGDMPLPLWEHSQKKGLDIGAQAVWYKIADPTYSNILSEQYNRVVVDGEVDFGEVYPKADSRPRFKHFDMIMDFVEQQDMSLEVHHLVSNHNLPEWLTQGSFSRDQLIEILQGHIQTIGEKYKGKVDTYSIVTDSAAVRLWGDDQQKFWEKAIGPDYVDIVARKIHEIDPDVELLLNEDHIHDQKAEYRQQLSQEVYAQMERLLIQGTPVHLGMQMHLKAEEPPQKDDIVKQMHWFKALGEKYRHDLKVYVTEATVDGGTIQQKAEIFQTILSACLEVGPNVCPAFSTFGFTDDAAWISGLPYDKEYQQTEIYKAMSETLQA